VLHDALTRIARATDNLIATQTHSVLTIRGYTTFFIRWLIPRLPAFQRIHANIEVRLVAATDPVDFDRDAVDIGIRYGRGHWRGWRGDLLFMDELSPVCDPGYLAQRDASSPATLITASTLLHHNRRPSDWTEWLAAAGIAQVLHANVYFEDLSIVYECARAISAQRRNSSSIWFHSLPPKKCERVLCHSIACERGLGRWPSDIAE
jgi:LysR family glycine cleavage system transcriptional activator